MKRVLLLAIGNDWRCDDGAAHAMAALLHCSGDLESRAIEQLTPEVAEDIAGYEAVIFADADARAAELSIAHVSESLNESAAPNPFTHVSTPAGIVILARALFGFTGLAFLCRIPAWEFGAGTTLSRRASLHAGDAARQLEILAAELCAGGYEGRLR